MPELPEVETTLRGVSPYLVGRVIREVSVRHQRLRWPVPDEVHEMEGQRITTAERRGKYLIFHTPAGALLLHLGMSGSLRVSAPVVPWRKHDHFALATDRDMQVRLHDPRRFGAVLWVRENPHLHPLLAGLGPEPLTAAFSVEYLREECKGRSATIKSVLMDSRVVVGVGNIYACESLFLARIDPRKAAGKVSLPRLQQLVQRIREVLAASIEMGGTTLRDFMRENGEPGYFAQTLRVYGREGEACGTCGEPVRRVVMTGRSTFYCPRCQK